MPPPPAFEGRDSAFETADLVWWLPRVGEAPEGWFDLAGHACNGFSIDYLTGWVRPLDPSPSGLKLLEDIADEDFAKPCDVTDLDYGVTDQHREAYSSYLAQRGLEAGELRQLVQAVYPLAASRKKLLALGADTECIPSGACLLILGTNCD